MIFMFCLKSAAYLRPVSSLVSAKSGGFPLSKAVG
jgi:hypothetical protein